MIYSGERPEKMGYPIEGVADDAAGGAAAEVPIASLLPKADVNKGADTFKQCGACHTVNQGGANGIGPNLYAVVGDAVAQGRGGFPFSDALKTKGGKWDFDALNAWLTSPRKYAPGTKMTFAGLGKPDDRANVIAYLNSQGSNLPYPSAPAAAPGVAGKGGPADKPASPNSKATPTANEPLSNTAQIAGGAPSVDKGEQIRADKAAKKK
jgi:cytochrome c